MVNDKPHDSPPVADSESSDKTIGQETARFDIAPSSSRARMASPPPSALKATTRKASFQRTQIMGSPEPHSEITHSRPDDDEYHADPWRFGLHPVDPEVRKELSACTLPEMPAERLFETVPPEQGAVAEFRSNPTDHSRSEKSASCEAPELGSSIPGTTTGKLPTIPTRPITGIIVGVLALLVGAGLTTWFVRGPSSPQNQSSTAATPAAPIRQVQTIDNPNAPEQSSLSQPKEDPEEPEPSSDAQEMALAGEATEPVASSEPEERRAAPRRQAPSTKSRSQSTPNLKPPVSEQPQVPAPSPKPERRVKTKHGVDITSPLFE